MYHSGSDLNRIITFIQDFISNLLKSNPYIEKALINASIKLGGVLTTDTNSIKLISFLDNYRFSKFYGFTDKEVDMLLKKFKVSEKLENVEEWYGGYKIENKNNTVNLYNPFSIVSYLEFNELKSFWHKSGYIVNIDKIFLNEKIHEKIDSFFDKSNPKIFPVSKIDISHILRLQDMINDIDRCTLDSKDVNLFIQFMVDMGYFTVLNKGYLNSFYFLELQIPNKEIEIEIKNHLYTLSFYRQKYNVRDENIDLYVNSINNLGTNKKSYKNFAKSILRLFSSRGMPHNERNLQNPLIAFASFSGKFKVVESEQVRNTNRFMDLLIIRKDLTGIIIQLKYKLSSSYKAIEQIINNNYYNIFKTKYKDLQIHTKIYIGLFLSKQQICSLSYLYNNTNVRKTVTISNIIASS
ncbi:uncharacterized protein LOC142330484 [Lycorma delicatula]|uniref:uncharacterized protein LOC142330484 n=1 Tax=Lycorma delicatula TaxID=130591 RepID=UPI003F5168DA